MRFGDESNIRPPHGIGTQKKISSSGNVSELVGPREISQDPVNARANLVVLYRRGWGRPQFPFVQLIADSVLGFLHLQKFVETESGGRAHIASIVPAHCG